MSDDGEVDPDHDAFELERFLDAGGHLTTMILFMRSVFGREDLVLIDTSRM